MCYRSVPKAKFEIVVDLVWDAHVLNEKTKQNNNRAPPPTPTTRRSTTTTAHLPGALSGPQRRGSRENGDRADNKPHISIRSQKGKKQQKQRERMRQEVPFTKSHIETSE